MKMTSNLIDIVREKLTFYQQLPIIRSKPRYITNIWTFFWIKLFPWNLNENSVKFQIRPPQKRWVAASHWIFGTTKEPGYCVPDFWINNCRISLFIRCKFSRLRANMTSCRQMFQSVSFGITIADTGFVISVLISEH